MNPSLRSLSILASLATALIAFSAVSILGTPAASAGVIAPKSSCKSVPQSAGTAKARKSMLCFTNYARARKGLKKYRPHRKLNNSSKRKAQDIVRCNDFSHTACGRQFDYWIKRSGYRGCSVGENLAWGSGTLGSSREIFKAWMNSPGHRAAILSTEFQVIGIGKKVGKLNGYSGAGIWVQHFGAGC
jgi:uncharacterized protein YkwD